MYGMHICGIFPLVYTTKLSSYITQLVLCVYFNLCIFYVPCIIICLFHCFNCVMYSRTISLQANAVCCIQLYSHPTLSKIQFILT